MNRAFYHNTISEFLLQPTNDIIGELSTKNNFALEQTQRDAWIKEIEILKNQIQQFQGSIYFEYTIPRMGRRVDVVLLINQVIFVIEFKIGESEFSLHAIDQVWDYALDLMNFHDTSRDQYIVPILVATRANNVNSVIVFSSKSDKLLLPIKCNTQNIGLAVEKVLAIANGEAIDVESWQNGRYCPTPTIIEAAKALYNGHAVEDISRNDASAINLSCTSSYIAEVIQKSKINLCKSICFVTGVPGAGKTLVGLNIATNHIDKSNDLYSVFLSGNGPLVEILREALTRDKVQRVKDNGSKIKKGETMSEVKTFIQNVHHFRDDCLIDHDSPPIEHVALFDEAQRAWNLTQTSSFMLRKKNTPDFMMSEPEFLISCLDRHPDWAVIVCLVGGGQEINTGEAGITEWIEALNRSFPDWHIYISPRLTNSEYGTGTILNELVSRDNVYFKEELHLSTSMRSFRSEHVSLLVKQLLDLQQSDAQKTLNEIGSKYPIVLTRNLNEAKRWLKKQARGSERFGVVASSQAYRLKPLGIDIKSEIDPVHWFLDGKDDVRSSYYLEDVATEFDIQGLELDWTCVVWDADFRYSCFGWEHWSFCGSRWNQIRKDEKQIFLKNAYRVLLTRARQGMVIVVPNGDNEDLTRDPNYYDNTYHYLKDIGFEVI